MSSSDPVRALTAKLREEGQVFRVDDLLLRGKPLSELYGSNWKQLSLAACRIVDGTELEVSTSFPQRVRVSFCDTEEQQTVLVSRGENCWERIRSKISLPSSKPYNVFYQVFSPDPGFVQAPDGISSNDRSRMLGRKFLTPTEGLRADYMGHPVLHVDHKDFFRCHASSGLFHCEAVPASALFEAQYAVMIEGLHFADSCGVTQKFFVSIKNGYLDCYALEVRQAADLSFDGLTGQRMVALFPFDCEIPCLGLPQDQSVRIWTRWRQDLSVANHCVQKTSKDAPLDSHWVMLDDCEAFHAAFNQCLRL